MSHIEGSRVVAVVDNDEEEVEKRMHSEVCDERAAAESADIASAASAVVAAVASAFAVAAASAFAGAAIVDGTTAAVVSAAVQVGHDYHFGICANLEHLLPFVDFVPDKARFQVRVLALQIIMETVAVVAMAN